MLPKSPRRFDGERSLLAGLAIDALGNGMYIPFSLIFFRHVTGLPLAVIGLVLTATGLVSMALLPSIGTLTDRFGARRMQLALYLVRALGFAAYPFAHALPVFGAVALVTTIATQGFPAVQQARIGELARGTDLERINALARSLANAGLGAGSLLAALLVSRAGNGGYTVAAWLNGASFLIAAVLVRRVPAGPAAPGGRSAEPTSYREVLRDRPFLSLTTANLLIALGYAALSVLLPVYATGTLHTPGSVTGLAFAVNTVLCAALGVPAGRLVRRFATRNRAAAAGAALFAAGFLGQALLVPAAGRWIAAGLLAAVAVTTVGEVLHNPAASALVATVAPAALRGRYMATYQLSWSLSKALAPSLFTGLLTVNTRLPWLLLAAGTVLGAGMLLRLERRLPAEAVRPQNLVTAA
ncbi:MFS transporter [Kitasatospora sp. RB6PN24]|uniref:MFS transporter n=1 Tax=Kitasatospora humi TaxID=2893891 RepID=UPI001E285C93|nr:MFS transporter [Kitasatospora humi]MCC9307357.1 MFS transporter [Kitasatospora humi]